MAEATSIMRKLKDRAREVLGAQHQAWLERPNRCLQGKTPYECPDEALEALIRIEHGVFF